MDLKELTLKKFAAGFRRKEFSAREVAEEYFRRIREKDGEVHAYLHLMEKDALAAADAADAALAKGEKLPPLAGAPIALKDNMLVEGHLATAGSKILENYESAYDAFVVRELKGEGAVLLGKTNLDEFAMGSSTENSAFGPTRNPHDTSRVPGGSSGGSAAAVAADMALAALGSDTGGSIRQPAAFCGVVGLKPTYGAVSRSGLIALASSLDQIGPFAKTAEDAAILFSAIAGQDPLDATSEKIKYGPELTAPDFKKLSGLTIGLPKEYFTEGMSPEVQKGVESAIQNFRELGLKFVEVSLPHTPYALSTYYIILPAEASSNLARFDGIRYAGRPDLPQNYFAPRGAGFGAEPKRRIILGTFVLSAGYYDAYYKKAQAVRALVRRDFMDAFRKADVLLTPVTPTAAFKIGEKTADPLSMYLSDMFTIPVNLANLPGVSIPVRGIKGLPVGFQLVGAPFREADILGLGQLYEKN